MQPGERHIHRHDGCVDGNRQAQHEEFVERLAALPDQPGQRKGGHQSNDKRDDNGGNSHDGAVEEVFADVADTQRAGIVGPQPVLRQSDDVFTEDLRVVLQREGEHPVYGEEVDEHPEDQTDIDGDPGRLGIVFHGLSPPP